MITVKALKFLYAHYINTFTLIKTGTHFAIKCRLYFTLNWKVRIQNVEVILVK
jgi:hypothetical protein